MKTRKFVKYRNKKLHEIGESTSYVTMLDLRDMILRGDGISVIDDQTQEDLTSVTLARVLYETVRDNSIAYSSKTLRSMIIRLEDG